MPTDLEYCCLSSRYLCCGDFKVCFKHVSNNPKPTGETGETGERKKKLTRRPWKCRCGSKENARANRANRIREKRRGRMHFRDDMACRMGRRKSGIWEQR